MSFTPQEGFVMQIFKLQDLGLEIYSQVTIGTVRSVSTGLLRLLRKIRTIIP